MFIQYNREAFKHLLQYKYFFFNISKTNNFFIIIPSILFTKKASTTISENNAVIDCTCIIPLLKKEP